MEENKAYYQNQGGIPNGNDMSQPPPAYNNQQNMEEANQSYAPPGQTYYAPPPQQPGPVPPPQEGGNYPRQNRVTAFYSPRDNRGLAWKRRCCSIICCCIVIGLVVGLSAGLTHRNYNSYGYGYNSGYGYIQSKPPSGATSAAATRASDSVLPTGTGGSSDGKSRDNGDNGDDGGVSGGNYGS